MADIKRRERDAVLQSLQAGLVPRLGLHLLQVGRKDEVAALLKDLERIEQGGAAFRIVVGRFGSGKSFFLNLIRTLALQKRLVVVQADITMERRIRSTGGEARALYSELMRNLATKSKPDGGALRNLCEGWISDVHHKVTQAGGSAEDVKRRIHEDLSDLQENVGGFAFAEVIAKYYEGHASGNEELQSNALRWLRGEYTTKTEAREDLGVRQIIEDENFYDSLKLMAAFCAKAGFGGLVVGMDELVVLSHRLPNTRSRQANYEALLAIINDCYQGGAANIGFLLAGTDECLEDKRRGLHSYEALRSRLVENSFAGADIRDFSGPVVRLQNLTPEDLFVLLRNIRHVHAAGDANKYIVPDDALVAVLQRANETLGAEYFKTPRDVVRSFVGLLNVLEQNPGRKWQEFVGVSFIKKQEAPTSVEEELALGAPPTVDEDGDLQTFKL
ncbi:MAG TPA: ATP-binding protein [Verrucomicrobiae bacterium]|nr:ATP-binding protein [Verrucomicrobiae bacterium]